MLAFFTDFRIPDVPGVTIFRDHANPQQFYAVRERPRIATDEATGMPIFGFTLFSRNADVVFESAKDEVVESQLGWLQLAVDLALTNDEMAKVTAHCKGLLEAELTTESGYNKLFKTHTTATTPSVGYPTWLEGTVKLETLEGLGPTFKKSSSPEAAPSLSGANSATLWASYGMEAAQLLWDTLKGTPASGGSSGSTGSGGAKTSIVYAMVRYDLKLAGRLPALRVTVQADAKTVYEEVRKRLTVHETNGGSSFTYPQISELTKTLQDEHVIDVRWEDWGLPEAQKSSEIVQQLEQAVLNVVTTQIIQRFFTEFQVKGIDDDDLGETFTHLKIGAKGSRLWLNDYKESFSGSMSFSFERSANFVVRRAPSTSVMASLTPDQVSQLVRIVDVGTPEIQFMAVTVSTNADFAADKIANVTVSLSYRQLDSLTQKWVESAKTFVFRTGQESNVFRTRLARDDRGRLVDRYDVKAQINYIGTSHAPPPIELRNVSERGLTLSYDRLGYVKVDVQAGDVDWTQISKILVDLSYDAASGEPDAKKTVILTEKVPVEHWSTSKHGKTSNRYSYSVRYVFTDGSETSTAPRSDERGALTINDTLANKLRRTFDVVMDPQTVESVLLKIRYEDPPNPILEDRHLFTSTGSWEYARSLREGAPEGLLHGYSVQYKDGLSEDVPERALAPGQPLETFKAKRWRFNISVDGSALDWSKYRFVIVELTYRDPAHEYLKQEELRITAEKPFLQMEVFGFAAEAREYAYRATFVPKDVDADPIEVPAGGDEARRSGILLLQRLV